MLRFFQIRDGVIHTLAISEPHIDLTGADWIDAYEPDDHELQLLEQLLHTEVPELDEVEEIEDSARCFVDTAGIHIHALFLTQSEGRHNTVTVACILQKDRLLTIREGDPADFRLLRMRARRGQVEARSPAELLITLLEQKIENHADGVEDIHRKLEAVSYTVLED